jgi:hypothetical protein
MELCSLDDAFNTSMQGPPNSGCTDAKATSESRRQERKKARRCRGPALMYNESDTSISGMSNPDPDRPSMKKMEPVPMMNNATGLREHAPVEQDWGTKEPFVGESDTELKTILSVARKNVVTKAPSYFGASPSEDAGSPLPRSKTKEGFQGAPYANIIGEEGSFENEESTADSQAWQQMKQAKERDFPKAYSLLSPGAEGLESSELPAMERSYNWKQGTIPGGQSSFWNKFKQLQAPLMQFENEEPDAQQTQSQTQQNPDTLTPEQSRELLRKMDEILARLDDKNHVSPETAQREVLLFIMTGLGVMFLMDVASRTASKLF